MRSEAFLSRRRFRFFPAPRWGPVLVLPAEFRVAQLVETVALPIARGQRLRQRGVAVRFLSTCLLFVPRPKHTAACSRCGVAASETDFRDRGQFFFYVSEISTYVKAFSAVGKSIVKVAAFATFIREDFPEVMLLQVVDDLLDLFPVERCERLAQRNIQIHGELPVFVSLEERSELSLCVGYEEA